MVDIKTCVILQMYFAKNHPNLVLGFAILESSIATIPILQLNNLIEELLDLNNFM